MKWMGSLTENIGLMDKILLTSWDDEQTLFWNGIYFQLAQDFVDQLQVPTMPLKVLL